MLTNWIRNKHERKLIYLAIAVSIIVLLFGWWTLQHTNLLISKVPSQEQTSGKQFHHESNPLKFYGKSKGSLARIGVFSAFALFPLYLLIRSKKLSSSKELKKFLTKIIKWVKLVHVPIAFITFALIILHSIIMIFYEWHTNAVSITGVLTLILLLPFYVFGFLRYKRKDKNLHYYLSIPFILLMLVHTFV